MARSKNRSSEKKSPGASDKSPAKSDSKKNEDGKKNRANQDGWRETVESVVVAFVLAFLFRAFEAEAFVIPTGSMAPTLFGRHKECVCEMCEFHFVFGASDEIDDETGYYNSRKRINRAICPNCRFENEVEDLPVFKGDRILVNKFPYEFSDPKRWDVPVFKYPERPTTNYIKRMIGLPNETIVIERGDVFVEEGREQTILRMPPDKQWRLQIPVYDNNHPESPLHERGWPKRWAAVERSEEADRPAGSLTVAGWSEAQDSWVEESETHSFLLEVDRAKEVRWLRYRHIVPDYDDWAAVTGEAVVADDEDQERQPAPQLITDFCGYNSYRGGNGNPNDDCYWVGDLTVSFVADVQKSDENSELIVELNEGDRRYRVNVDLGSGQARLTSVLSFAGDEEELLGEAETDLQGQGEYEIRFANVDSRLCFWVDGDLIDFGEKANYAVDASELEGPLEEDLIPVGIAAANTGVRVSDLLIERDIYYRASQIDNDDRDRFAWQGDDEHPDPGALRRELKRPEAWGQTYRQDRNRARFVLGPDEYLMLGDNSPRSQDSRVWPNARGAERRHAVPRSALVGRAFYIYWPHGIPFLNDGHGYPVHYHRELGMDGTVKTDYADFRFPFYPNFCRMKRIR